MKITRILQVKIPYINTIIAYLILLTISFLTANGLYLSVLSVFPKLSLYDMPYGIVLHIGIFAIVLTVISRWWYTYVEVSMKLQHVLLMLPYLFIILLRFPILYPTADDMAGHFMFGDYARTIWLNHHFMPTHLSTYFYPAVDMLYTPFLFSVGLRITILILYLVVSIWHVSLYVRFLTLVDTHVKRFLLTALFVILPYIPHLIAIHGTLMVDYIALAITLEAFYQFMRKNTDYTFAVFLLLLTMLVKQSTSVFILPFFMYFMFTRRHKIKWQPIIFFCLAIGLYFIRLEYETGNILFGLYNGFFKSALYDVGNFRDTAFGPLTLRDSVLWPIIGQFTDRYGQGFTTPFERMYFSWMPIIGYTIPLIFIIRKRSVKYLCAFASYVLWIGMSGYSRYVIPLNMLVILSIIIDSPIPNISVFKKKYILIPVLMLIWFFSLSSTKTDFSWRPTFNIFSERQNNHYLWTGLYDGSKLLFKDTLGAYVDEQEPLFKDYQAIVPVYRGDATFLAYLGSKNGIPVIKAVSIDEEDRIIHDPKISPSIKNNLLQLRQMDRVILLVERTHEDIHFLDRKMAINRDFACTRIGQYKQSRYFQARNQFHEIVTYDCRNNVKMKPPSL